MYNTEEEIQRIPMNIVIDAADVKVNKNNFLANLPIDKVKGTRMETMMGFLLNHPIRGDLLVNPEQIVHHYLCEFWHTAKVFDVNDPISSIQFYLKGVAHTLDLDTYRRALNLAYLDTTKEVYDEIPSEEDINFRQTLYKIDHPNVSNQHGDLLEKGTPTTTPLEGTWKLFYGTLVEYLGTSSGSADQINSTIMKIAYCLYKDLKVDYAKILYIELVKKVHQRGKKATHVPYIRFLSQVFRNSLGDLYLDPNYPVRAPVPVVKDYYSAGSKPSDHKLPSTMLTHVPETNRFDNPISSPSSSERTLSQSKESETEEVEPQNNEGLTSDVGTEASSKPKKLST